MKAMITRRIEALEERHPTLPRRVAIVAEDAPAPPDADFVIRIVAAQFSRGAIQ